MPDLEKLTSRALIAVGDAALAGWFVGLVMLDLMVETLPDTVASALEPPRSLAPKPGGL